MKPAWNWNSFCVGAVRRVVLMLTASVAVCGHAQRYPFHNLNVDDGLIQSQATSLAQDKYGNLWIGTLGGLSRFDGSNFTNYTIRNGLPGNAVWSLACDPAGNIWVGGQSVISRFDGKTFEHYTRQQQTVHVLNNTQQIQAVHDTVWWRVAGDLYFITGGKIKYFVTPGPPGAVSAILAEKDGLWIAKEGKVYHQYEDKVDTLHFLPNTPAVAVSIYRLFRDRGGLMWVTTNSGLYRIGQNYITGYPLGTDSLAARPAITCITQDKAGAIWLGTKKGAVKVAGKTVQYYNKHNGLSDNSFFDVVTDVEGNIWMASDGQGIFRFSGTLFTALDENTGLPSAQIMAFTSDKRDSLFLGTYDAGLYVFKDGRVKPLPFPSAPVPSITSLCYTHSKLWIGTHGRGLWTYDNGIFRQYEAPARNFPSNFINRIYEDAAKRIWIGFANGAVVYENDTFKSVAVKGAEVNSFLYLGKDSVLMASGTGLKLYSAGSVSEFKTNTIADSFSIQCFILRGRDLWMGSSDNGVIRYNLDTHQTLVINKSAGLHSDFIYNIVSDDDGNIWVGTGFGIHKIKMTSQNEPEVTFYGKDQGIRGMESNINSVLKMPDGSIWFGTTNGALHYQPHTSTVSPAPVSIVLQSVKLPGEAIIDSSLFDSSDKWYGIPYHLRLPYKKNSVAFTFHAVTLSGAQQVLYRYRMDGLDAPWSDWSPTSSVTYSALPPGVYVFHVQCQPADPQNYPELTYTFEIVTPFQKTKWFRLCILAGCILAGIVLQYVVSRRKQRRLRLLAKLRAEEQVKIRLRTAEDFHDEIGNRLTRINVLTNVLKSKIHPTPETLRILNQIEDNTSQLYGGTRDILWSLKPSNDNLYEILHRIRDFAGELFQDTDVKFNFSGADEKWRNYRLPMDMSRNLIMIFKEALNNCLKYAHAKNVTLDVQMKTRGVLQMVLRDDGKGFDLHTVKKGNGLNNMNIRATRLNGRLYIDSRLEKGTIITLTFKVPPNR